MKRFLGIFMVFLAALILTFGIATGVIGGFMMFVYAIVDIVQMANEDNLTFGGVFWGALLLLGREVIVVVIVLATYIIASVLGYCGQQLAK